MSKEDKIYWTIEALKMFLVIAFMFLISFVIERT